MPVLDYGDILETGDMYRAQIAVRAVMGWLNDAESRRQFLATLMSMNLAELERAGVDLPDPLTSEGWEDTIAAIEEHEDWLFTIQKVSEWFAEAGAITLSPLPLASMHFGEIWTLASASGSRLG